MSGDGIAITAHALAHWRGRCGMVTAADDRTAKRRLAAAVAAGRMATRLEARCLSLFVNDSRRWDSPMARDLSPERCIVSDKHGVGFVLTFEPGYPLVTTAAPMAMVYRRCRGLPGSKLRKLLDAGVV